MGNDPARPTAQPRQPHAGVEYPPQDRAGTPGEFLDRHHDGYYSHLMPNMQGEAVATVDGVMRAAINKRTDDVG